MLHIRGEQVDAFRADKERSYLRDLAKIMPDLWPGLCIALGSREVQAWIEHGFTRAREYGIKRIDNITRYVHLMFMLCNRDFDRSSETAWAASILGWKNAKEDLVMAALEKRARTVSEEKD